MVIWSWLVFITTLFNTHSVFALSSASTLAIHGSLTTGGTQIFILEMFGPLLILPRVNCSFHWPKLQGMIILRKTLKDLLWSTYNLLYLHYRIVVQFSPVNPASIITPSFVCWFRGMSSPKKLGGQLNFQFNDITVVSPGGSIPPSGNKTCEPVEHKVMETGSKILLVEH